MAAPFGRDALLQTALLHEGQGRLEDARAALADWPRLVR